MCVCVIFIFPLFFIFFVFIFIIFIFLFQAATAIEDFGISVENLLIKYQKTIVGK